MFMKRQAIEPLPGLPTPYEELSYDMRQRVRHEYAMRQNGMCYYCHSSLTHPPPDFIQEKRIDWDLFPEGFLRSPIHLHHSHDTGLTIGVVHALCNAVLWQYEGE